MNPSIATSNICVYDLKKSEGEIYFYFDPKIKKTLRGF